MEGWGGALACPDATGKYHAVGLYHTGQTPIHQDCSSYYILIRGPPGGGFQFFEQLKELRFQQTLNHGLGLVFLASAGKAS